MALRDGGHLDRTLNLDAKHRRVADLRGSADPAAGAALVALLGDESRFVRELAAVAVVERGRSLAGAVLGVLSGGLWYGRAAAAVVLGRMGAIDAAPAVAALLRDSNRTVRDAGYDALILLAAAGGERAVAQGMRQVDSGVRARFLDDARLRHPAVATRILDCCGDAVREPERGELSLEPVRT